MNPLRDFKKSFKEAVSIFIFLFLQICFFPPSLPALEVPSEWGQIYEKFEGTNGRTLVLIQEAHVDYGAQKAIVEILKDLIQRDSVGLILVEGGWEDMGLSYLRNYGSPKGRVEVAERYLREGKISAEEYLDIVSDLDFSIWGIEDPKLYAENMDAFLKFHEKQEKALKEISRVESELNPLKEKIYPPSLQEFEKKKQAFEEKKKNLLDYLHFLGRQADDAKLLDGLPHLKKLLAVTGGEGGIDPEKAEWEKQNLIGALSKKLTKPELETLHLLQERKTPQQEFEFLHSLLTFYQRYRKNLGPLSLENLSRYAQALEEVSATQPKEIFGELGKLEASVVQKLIATPDPKDLYRLSGVISTLKKLFELKLGPEEFDGMEKNSADFELGPWSQRFSLPDLEPLEKQIPEAKAFYSSARRREQALIENTVRKVEEEKNPLTAMIVGGFHADALAQALNERGYSLVVVAPRFTPADPQTQSQHYFEILKSKWGAANDAALHPTQQKGALNHVAQKN